MKKINLILLVSVFLLTSLAGFSQSRKVIKNDQQKEHNTSQMISKWKAPGGQMSNIVEKALDSDPLRVNEEAYAGNTTVGRYYSLDLATGDTVMTGSIGSDPFPMAEEYADGAVYRIYSDMTLEEVNPDDGTTTALGTMSGVSGTPTGLAYDWGTSTMYVVVLDASNIPQLCTLDMTTYALTLIGTGEGMLIAMDFDINGDLYGPSLNDTLYQIDPATGATTIVGPVGFDVNYGQDVSYDYISQTMYSITCGAQYSFGSYDLSTGTFTEILSMGSDQYGTIVVCNPPADPAAPAASTDLLVTPDAGGALTADVSWTNPTLDVSGSALSELTLIELFIDGEATASYSNSSPTIGGAETYTATVAAAGMHTFTVVGTNSVGEGIPVSETVWVGEDVPAAPTNVVLTATGMDASLSWTAPTEGLHGGYFSGTGVTYDVIRYPGAVLVADDQTATTFTETLVDANVYSYEVIASNAVGEGGAAMSNELTIGDLLVFDFESGEPLGTQFVDGDCGWMIGTDGSSSYWTIPAHGTYAYVNDDACNADMSDVWMILPAVDFTGVTAPFMKFSNVRNNDIFTVKVSTDSVNWTDVVTLSTDNITEWQEETVDLSAYAGEPDILIAFHYNDDGNWGYGWAVDDIMISGQIVTIDCPGPSDLNATGITTTSADLSWTENGTATAWNIEYGEAGFVQGEGTVVSGVTNPYTLDGLSSGTAYEFYVQADCDSWWEGPYLFTTLCDIVATYPYHEGFETMVPPACWIVNDVDGDGYGWSAIDYQVNSGSYAAMSASYDNDLGGALTPDNYLISPQFEINQSNLELGFYVATVDPDWPSEKYSVLVSTTGTNVADFTEIYTETLVAADTVFRQVVLPLSAYDGESIYIAIRHWDVTDMFQMAIDDFEIDAAVGENDNSLSRIAVYPNPANNMVTVENAENAEISIVNMLGQVVAIKVADSNRVSINTADLTEGTYIIRIENGDEVSTQKLNVIR
jgi:hypothetical protein